MKKTTQNIRLVSLVTSTLFLIAAPAIGKSVQVSDSVSVDANLGVEWRFFRIEHSTNARGSDDQWLENLWMQSLKSLFVLRANVHDALSINVSYYGIMDFSIPGDIGSNVQSRRSSGGMDEASATYRFRIGRGKSEEKNAGLTVGYFPFEYTYQWQRLGGYLFKTGVYPGYILSTLWETRLIGLLGSIQTGNYLSHKLIVTIERDLNPKNDVSLSYLGAFTKGPVEIGLGGMLYRLLRTDQGHFYYSSNLFPGYAYTDKDGNSVFYRSAGIKVLGRACVDIARILNVTQLGKNSLKLYAEAAILGVVDQGVFYDDLLERIPVMGGLTLPTPKFLDVAGIEVEYYGSRWKNSMSTTYTFPVPVETFEQDGGGWNINRITNPEPGDDGGRKARTDNFKWAVFVEKTIQNRLTIGVHAASDHFRAPNSTGDELLHAPDEWYWQLTLETSF